MRSLFVPRLLAVFCTLGALAISAPTGAPATPKTPAQTAKSAAPAAAKSAAPTAKPAAPAEQKFTLKNITLHSLSQLSPARAKELMALETGAVVSEAELNAALHKLYETGYFKNISMDLSRSGVLAVHFEQKPFVAKITLKGAANNDKKHLEQIIGIKKGSALDEEKIRLAKQNIITFYEARGFFGANVAAEQIALKSGAVELVLEIYKGEKITIKQMNLIGAKALKYGDIAPVVANKQREFFGWMWGFDDGRLRSLELPADPARIKEAYFQKGYMDASISAPFLQANMQNHTAQLNYYISEGERYKVASVGISGLEGTGVDVSKIKLKTKAKKWINSAHLRRDAEQITQALQDEGYAFAQVLPQFEKAEASGEGSDGGSGAANSDSAANAVKITFAAQPGEVYHINDVIISGNDKSSDRIIRRELYLLEGKRFSRTDLNDSMRALRKTGYFGDVAILPQKSFEPGKLNLIIKITEERTGTISGGLGYSSADGLLINASVADRNILGSGLKGSLSLEKSKKDFTGKISLENPRLFDTRVSLGGSVYSYLHEWEDYEELNHGVQINIARTWARYFTTGLSHTYEQSDLRKATLKMTLTGEKLGKSIKSAATPYVIYDSTDDYFLPRSGIYARAAFTYAGIGGDQKYKKLTSEFKYFYGLKELIDWDLIFRVRVQANKLFDYDDAPLNSRLYLGGLSTVRGYNANSIGPKGLAYFKTGWGKPTEKITAEEYEAFKAAHPSQTPIEWALERVGVYEYDRGGALSANASAELSFPISDKLKLRGSVFYDYGSIGLAKLGEIKRSSTGVSLDWTTPMGPLVFVFARPLDDQPGDKTSRFEFSVGSAF